MMNINSMNISVFYLNEIKNLNLAKISLIVYLNNHIETEYF